MRWSRLSLLVLYLALFASSLALAAYAGFSYSERQRGVESQERAAPLVVGTNVALEQYLTAANGSPSDAELDRAFELLQRAGITIVRQYFPWREIEKTPGVYDWALWDRVVRRAQQHGIQLVPVLFTAPEWAQRDYERDLPTAPPDDFEAFARFAGEFAKRYGDSVTFYQVWDEPNVHPSWGRRNADPVEYAQLLAPAARALRAADPDARIVLAGLAMNLETQRPHPDYSEVLFLRGLYEIGADEYFDVVAAKPYGMWTGPEDRRVHSGVLNFSRLVLLRDEMRQYGDAETPVWAVEMGWNALPANWDGAPSPWGADTPEIQAARLERALVRARDEWSWLTAVFPQHLHPNAPPDDPRLGFALATENFAPTPFYDVLARFIANPPPPTSPPTAPWLPVALLFAVAGVSAWGVWRSARLLRVDGYWRELQSWFAALPLSVRFGALALVTVAFWFSPNVVLNFLLLAALVVWFALQLDLSLMVVVFTIPFWNYPKTLFGGFQLSAVETLTWASAAAFLLDILIRTPDLSVRWRALPSKLSSLDWSVLALIGLGLVSTRVAGNFGVASREFRFVILTPALLYALVRLLPPAREARARLVTALLLSGAVVCLIGLAQFATGDVIAADGVRRIRAVWGSPNNVGLYLGRLLPIALALAILLPATANRQRWFYAALAGLYGVTILLTFSRGALFLGVPASMLFLAFGLARHSAAGRRAAGWLLGGLAAAALVAVLLLAGTERGQSFFQSGTGTGFFRVAVWTSAVAMIRDHPLFGVGLDNFLYEYPKYILPEAWREPNLSHPHNVVLDFWVRLGILGVAVLGWMLVAFYRRAWRAFTHSPAPYIRALMLGLMASMVNFLAHGLIDAAYFYIDLAYVFMLTLALVQTQAAEQE